MKHDCLKRNLNLKVYFDSAFKFLPNSFSGLKSKHFVVSTFRAFSFIKQIIVFPCFVNLLLNLVEKICRNLQQPDLPKLSQQMLHASQTLTVSTNPSHLNHCVVGSTEFLWVPFKVEWIVHPCMERWFFSGWWAPDTSFKLWRGVTRAWGEWDWSGQETMIDQRGISKFTIYYWDALNHFLRKPIWIFRTTIRNSGTEMFFQSSGIWSRIWGTLLRKF